MAKRKHVKFNLDGIQLRGDQGGRIMGNTFSREASASISLDKGDGATQFCGMCENGQEHTCGRREITEEERAVVNAAMAWHEDRNDWRCEPVLMQVLDNAVRALRQKREAGR